MFASSTISVPQAGDIIDAVNQQDQAMYQQLDLAKHFGVIFHPHQKVCDTAATDDAHCDARVTSDGRGKPLASPKFISGYGPAQFLKAYGISGVTQQPALIAIVDAYNAPNIQSDLNTYSAVFGIPTLPACTGNNLLATPCLKRVDQRGGTRYPSTNAGWALEISLDVEAAHAACQNCSIVLVEADSSSFNNLMAAVDRAVAMGATVVSNSYGANEFLSETIYDYHFNHPGVAFTVSSGDSGYGVEYPAASKYVTAVGGTTLLFNQDGSYNQELVWSGAGSGCSRYESKPIWQTDTGCSQRTVADVSADADPNTGAAVYDSTAYFGQRGWWQVGGTSLAAPLVAAVYAQSGNTTGSANSIPYTNVGALHDVKSGSNGSCTPPYLCKAGVGYDGPTGLGTPNGTAAF